jgi:hypothetical protein
MRILPELLWPHGPIVGLGTAVSSRSRFIHAKRRDSRNAMILPSDGRAVACVRAGNGARSEFDAMGWQKATRPDGEAGRVLAIGARVDGG